jgi:hypothetical protein
VFESAAELEVSAALCIAPGGLAVAVESGQAAGTFAQQVADAGGHKGGQRDGSREADSVEAGEDAVADTGQGQKVEEDHRRLAQLVFKL